ncbi:hypothetical protein ABBQ38_011435 [Trebouxia sp. C0009 RCD-2024]
MEKRNLTITGLCQPGKLHGMFIIFGAWGAKCDNLDPKRDAGNGVHHLASGSRGSDVGGSSCEAKPEALNRQDGLIIGQQIPADQHTKANQLDPLARASCNDKEDELTCAAVGLYPGHVSLHWQGFLAGFQLWDVTSKRTSRQQIPADQHTQANQLDPLARASCNDKEDELTCAAVGLYPGHVSLHWQRFLAGFQLWDVTSKRTSRQQILSADQHTQANQLDPLARASCNDKEDELTCAAVGLYPGHVSSATGKGFLAGLQLWSFTSESSCMKPCLAAGSRASQQSSTPKQTCWLPSLEQAVLGMKKQRYERGGHPSLTRGGLNENHAAGCLKHSLLPRAAMAAPCCKSRDLVPHQQGTDGVNGHQAAEPFSRPAHTPANQLEP